MAGATAATTNSMNPFTMVAETDYPLQFSQMTTPAANKQVHFDNMNFLEDAVDKLTDAVMKLTIKSSQSYMNNKGDQKQGQLNRPRDDKERFQKPYKPYITKGRDHPRYWHDDSKRQNGGMKQSHSFSRDRSTYPHRGRSRSAPHDGDD